MLSRRIFLQGMLGAAAVLRSEGVPEASREAVDHDPVEIVRSISDLATEAALIKGDHASLMNMLSSAGRISLGIAECGGDDEASSVAQKALEHRLMDQRLLSTADTVALILTGGPDLSLHQIEECAQALRERVTLPANIDLNVVVKDNMTGKVRVTVLAIAS